MTIEVCAFSLESCLRAQRAGANRVELCGGLAEGGTTPSYGLIELARQRLHIDLYVMIRPRGGDFLYTEEERDVMRRDIDMARQLKVDGLVFGFLNADGTVDEGLTREMVAWAHPLPVTFHRAFDVTRDPFEALEVIIRTGARRILTSGQQPGAEAGIPLLGELVRQTRGRIEIMAGAGVTPRNAALLAATGVQALHLTGKRTYESPMQFRQSRVPMASAAPAEFERIETDETVVAQVIGAARTQILSPPGR